MPVLSSIFIVISVSAKSSKTSLSVGILAPLNVSSPYEKSNSLSSAKVKSFSQPLPSEVLSIFSSWQTTSSPSFVICTSSSIPSAPSSIALAKAGSVFSGQYALAPRCAQTKGLLICPFIANSPIYFPKAARTLYQLLALGYSFPLQLPLNHPLPFFFRFPCEQVQTPAS